MTTAMPQAWSLERFLAWEGQQELRWEFDGFAPVAMTGGTAGHEAIGGTLRALLRAHLTGKPCRAWGPTLKIEVNGRIRYPDAFVSCTPFPRERTIAPAPVVVFEVLSPSTSYTDRIAKVRDYQATASILRYVILEQDSVAATVLARRGADWVVTTHAGDEHLAMPEIDVVLSLAEIYSDLDLTHAE
jgi:Uma2 family endonuclease